MTTNKEASKIIVIGAGIAGLAAAKELKEKGLDCLVLEGQDRIGGRIKTVEDEGVTLDHGASWIHGVFENPLSEIVLSENIETSAADGNNNFLLGEGGVPIKDDGKVKRLFRTFEKKVAPYIKRGHSLEAALRDHVADENVDDDLFAWHKHDYMAGAGVSLYNIDAKAYFTDEASRGGDGLLTGGYDQLLKPLAEGLDIRLGENITKIECGQGVKLTTAAGKEYDCDAIVLTVPLGVLQQKKIEFFPPLPTDKTNAIHTLEMGVLNKSFCWFDSCFWPEGIEGFGVAGENYQDFPYVLNCQPFTGENILCFFSYGRDALAMEDLSDSELTERIHEYLKPAFGQAPAVKKMTRTRWGSDQWSYGSYSYVAKGRNELDYGLLGKSYLDRIFFAGEATIADYRGTTHGAYLSGLREAKKILKFYS